MKKGLILGLIAGAAAAGAAALIYSKKKNEYCCCDDLEDEDLACDDCCGDCCDCDAVSYTHLFTDLFHLLTELVRTISE